MPISNNLDLYVFHTCKIFLQIYSRITKSLLGFLLCRGNLLDQRILIFCNPDSFSAAAGSSLDNNRVSDITSYHNGLVHILNQAVRTRNNRHIRFNHRLLGDSLIPHAGDGIRRWTNKRDIAGSTDFCEISILSQESISRVNRITLCECCNTHQIGKVQITVFGQGWADTIGFIRQSDMKRILVRFRIYGY
ncbi:hypothetical protein D3C71_1043450 [compost metagenome]